MHHVCMQQSEKNIAHTVLRILPGRVDKAWKEKLNDLKDEMEYKQLYKNHKQYGNA